MTPSSMPPPFADLGPPAVTAPTAMTHPAHHESFSLAAAKASVPKARHQVRDALARWGLDTASTDTALLILTELVTNAVLHASALSPRSTSPWPWKRSTSPSWSTTCTRSAPGSCPRAGRRAEAGA
jgi:hypothetical protein